MALSAAGDVAFPELQMAAVKEEAMEEDPLAAFQQLALQADKPVYIANEDDTIRVDARSFLGLFTLDFSKPLKVVTDSLYVMRRLEIRQRERENTTASIR